jgi:predicted esterase
MDPVIPAVSGDCPMWANGTITFMGLSGIQVAVGTKPAGPTAPMLFYWHGTGSTSGEYSFMAAQVSQGITAAGGVIVSFMGTTGGDLLSGTSIFGASDFKLTDQLLACAIKDHNVDPRKVYATGCSAGGLFSIAMAAERSGYIAAAASNSGGETVPVAFQNKHTPPIMCVHGKMGTDVVGIDFAQASATAEKAFNTAGASIAIDCDTGMGHCGGSGFAPDVWAFFQAHPFGVSPEPWASGLPSTINPLCKIVAK